MKILFFTRLFWPHIGGVEKHVLNVSQELIRKGHQVTVVTSRDHRGYPTDDVVVGGIKVKRIPVIKAKLLGLFRIWLWVIRNIGFIKEFDIIHVHDVFIWLWPVKVLLPSKKIFVTFHGHSGQFPLNKIDVLQKRLAAALSSGHIDIGDYISTYYGFSPGIINYGGVRYPRVKVKKAGNLVLYVGRLDQTLPIKTICKTLGLIIDSGKYKAEFCGDGELRKKAEKYGKVYGFIDPTDKFKKAKFVFASGYLSAMEGMINKCLVFVSFDNKLQRDYFYKSPLRKYLVCEFSADKLYRKFVYYQNHTNERNELVINAYNWVSNQTWGKVVKDYLRLWKG